MNDTQPQQQVPPPGKEIHLPQAGVVLERTPDGQAVRLGFRTLAPNEITYIVMDAESAAKLGQELIGSRFVVAGANEMP